MFVGAINWIGTFTKGPGCDTNLCCCPKSDLVIIDGSNKTNATISIEGACLKPNASLISFDIDKSADNVTVQDVGIFTVKENMTVTLFWTSTQTACPDIIMKRSSTTLVLHQSTGSPKPGDTTIGNQNQGNGVTSHQVSFVFNFVSSVATLLVMKTI
ncbi:unnamed protein product [Adineta ricciae]|uniref:Uncharacterized protein n=1 Tax=Adineta ricciae TaxID=249248 RepID=A0A814RWA5_ADIRI|nr:unnamed protein product [Adineta ricciae]